MFEVDSAKFITAITFAVSAVLLIILAYAIHLLASSRRLNRAQKNLGTLMAKLSTAEENHRKRIAEELHDRIGETLVVTSRSIEALNTKLLADDAQQELNRLSETIQKFLKGARSLIFDLIPPALYDVGLKAAVDAFITSSRTQYQIDLRLVDDGHDKLLAAEVAAFLYKATRELVLNVVKHSGADQATIRLKGDGKQYTVVVEDNGVGFSADSVSNSDIDHNSFGLFNIRIQAEYYGGYVEIGPPSGKGGHVKVSVPLGQAER